MQRWNNNFNSVKIKKSKYIHKRYEVSKLGLIQHDIKIFTTDLTGMKKTYYMFDFIDELTRYSVGYVYESKGTLNAIGAVRKAIKEFEAAGIYIKRIRTDNGSEYVKNLYRKEAKEDSEFTTFLKEKGIVHETTPIRTPQANGKIERFHQNWNKFITQIKKKCSSVTDLRKNCKIFLGYYNTIRPHKSLGLKTPIEAIKNLNFS